MNQPPNLPPENGRPGYEPYVQPQYTPPAYQPPVYGAPPTAYGAPQQGFGYTCPYGQPVAPLAPQADPKAARSAFSRVGIAVTLLLGLQFLFSNYVFPWLVLNYAPQLVLKGWFYWALAYVPLYGIGFPAFLLVLHTVPNSPLPAPPNPKMDMRGGAMVQLVLISTGVMYLLNMFSQFLAEFIRMLRGAPVTNPLSSALISNDLIVSLVVVVLIAPIMEEIVFRWLTYKKLVRYGGKTYIFVTATLFALFHLNIYQLFYAFALGLVLGGVMYFTGEVQYCIILHMIINFFGSAPSLIIGEYGTETMLIVWGVIYLLLAVIGLIVLVNWFVRRRHLLRFPLPTEQLPDQKLAWLNPGMIIACGSMLGLIIWSFA